MKLLFSTLLILAVTCNINAQDSQIQFTQMDWESTLQTAKEQNKLIFVDCYTSWCGPCKWMSANVFTDKEVSQYYNENFINVKLNMERGEGPQLAREFKIRAYPTLLFVNGDGEIVKRTMGAKEANKFLKLGKKVIKSNSQTN